MAIPDPVVTKLLIPKRRSDLLRRQRLLDFLHEYIDRRLLLVSAAAGYGKTSLLIDFASDTDLPVCWFSLDAGDRDPQVFIEYLVASLQRRFPHFGGKTLALLHDTAQARNFDAVVGTLVTEIYDSIDSYFLIILDDYHLVDQSADINRLLDSLLEHLPENAHIILASRTVPTQLTLTQLTARLQVAGIGPSDLRFDANEIRALIQQNYRLEITEAAAQQLADQSEGWIAGIVLTTPSLWRGFLSEWAKGRGPGSQLFDFLATEVFAEQPADLQVFLQESAVLDQMNAAVCNELLGITDAHTLLQTIEARNLFITRLEEEEAYRYHHLFREFLLTRLQRGNPARWRAVHQRAAELFERRGKTNEAIEHWLKCEDYEQAARAIERAAGPTYDQGHWTTLARWLDTLPAYVFEANSRLLMWRGKIYTLTGALSEAQEAYERARAQFERQADKTNLADVLIEEATVAHFQGQSQDCLERCKTALALLDARQFGLNAKAHFMMGVALGRQSDWLGSISQLERAAALYQLANDHYNLAQVEHDLGVAFHVVGERAQANSHFQAALNYWRKLGNLAKLANTLNSIGVAHYQRGELDQARDLLEEALSSARQIGALRIEAYALASLGDVYRDAGEVERALQAHTDAYQLADKIREGFLITFTLTAIGDLWRLSGNLELAEDVLRSASELAAAHGSDYELGLVQTAMGALRLERGEIPEGLAQLAHALPLLERGQAKREAARAHYFIASAFFREHRFDEAGLHLQALAGIGAALDEYQFLLSEGKRALPLLRFAMAYDTDKQYFEQMLQRLEPVLERVSEAVIEVVESPWPRLEIFTLGPSRVICDGRTVEKTDWQGTTAKELFFFFVAQPQGGRREQIITTLWPDTQPTKANDIFHSSMYRIRRALFSECLVYRNGVYQWNTEAEHWTDMEEFEKSLANAEGAASPADAAEWLQRAVNLYRGDFLEEFYSDWQQTPRELLREKYLTALIRLAQYQHQAGKSSQAVELYQVALATDKLREETYLELMQIYADIGDRAGAVRVYQQCVKMLAQELAVEPMPETVALFKRITQRD